MKRNPVMLGLALTVVAFATAVSLGWLPMYPARADTTPAPAAVTAIANASRGTPLQSLLATPQARSYQQRQRFHNEARDFSATPPRWARSNANAARRRCNARSTATNRRANCRPAKA
ncbi:hypothetical protein [Lysobacter gummosus]|uniref:hypothetical protein n=1 Tax=Lysobacter gummosus TaxID=262324 RepID=UPI00363C6A64